MFFVVSDVTQEHPQIVELRFVCVVFGISSSPVLLNVMIQHYLNQCQTSSARVSKLKRAFYIDDVATGAEDESEAYQLYLTSKAILKSRGFNLWKFCSSSPVQQALIDMNETTSHHGHIHDTNNEEETYTCNNSVLSPNQPVGSGERKVLGVIWDLATEQLIVNLDNFICTVKDIEPTKRAIVGLVGQFYDPLGLVSPVTVVLKIFLQELCEARVSWDHQLTVKLLEKRAAYVRVCVKDCDSLCLVSQISRMW